ncbi:type II secretion system protein M [Serratia sp. UGAL515B_01]|uniref:type II secretion system protein M n=1 Tax=Serratia sp. UGAL515B_01 TaxID=2986763 RepID=UPI0029547435|nr:type II secretion system protein M [Serratia sp. UGAL515B_01]WON76407.1 type II secretion system protein M [Serratia sp. UGAL515B_01]
MNELKRRWLQISPRERGLLLGCGVLIVLSLCYYTLWQPWQQRAEQWQHTISREKDTVEWMSQQAPRLRQQTPPPVQGEPISLSATVTRSASAQGIIIARIQPQGERLAVTLEPSDFNRLMLWLTQLERQYRIRILAFDVAAKPEKPGWVAVNKLMLEHSDGR